tara:strand:- start:481 stop:1677 length:1197 start_codon:yes stop_codon:yes gene_type:complete
MNKINSWDEFQPLEELLVGSIYHSSFFNEVKQIRARNALKRIFDETQEDLENFASTMKSHNIKIYQPTTKELGYKDSIMDYVNTKGELGYRKNSGEIEDPALYHTGIRGNLIPNPPLQPRDDSIIMGNKLLVTDPGTFATKALLPKFVEWFGKENVDTTIEDKNYEFTRSDRNIKNQLLRENKKLTEKNIQKCKEENKLGSFCSPNLTRIGSVCLVDNWQVPTVIEDFLTIEYPMFNYRKISIGGHNDSVFSVIKPGLVVATRELEPYKNIFKNWDIIWFEDPNWNKVKKWKDLKHKNEGKWWVPGEEDNDEFTNFVESFIPNWTGMVEETIFDVNCLVIDDKFVVVNTENPHLLNNLRKHNMEPVICPLRHRFFWDGGWHCLTLDIKRKGNQVDYGL